MVRVCLRKSLLLWADALVWLEKCESRSVERDGRDVRGGICFLSISFFRVCLSDMKIPGVDVE